MTKNAIKALALTVLANKLLKKEISEEDLLSNPGEIEKYSKLLDRNLGKIYDRWYRRISDIADIGEKVDEILYYYRFFKFVCVDVKKYMEFYRVPYEKIKTMVDWETFLDWDTMWERSQELEEEDDELWPFMKKLRKCEYEKCGRWIVKFPKNKRFCNRLCASNNTQTIMRTKKPEKFKEYHKGYYKDYVSKKKRKRDEPSQAASKKLKALDMKDTSQIFENKTMDIALSPGVPVKKIMKGRKMK
jgi:hypothetical protein